MDESELLLFLRIQQRGSLSAAARDLGLSVATVSARLAGFEKKLDCRLFHRSTRRLALTDDGRTLLPHVERLLDSIEEARMVLSKRGQAVTGTLRLTASASFGRQHLVPDLASFMRTHPQLKVDLHLSDHVVDMLDAGFDLAIRIAARLDPGLVARRLCDDQRILCAGPSYLAEHGIPSRPEDLAEHQCLLAHDQHTWRFRTPQGGETRVRIRGRFRCNLGEGSREAAVAGLGIVLKSLWNCQPELQRGELLPVLANYPLVNDSAIWAVYPSQRLLAPRVRLLIDHLLQCWQSPPWSRLPVLQPGPAAG